MPIGHDPNDVSDPANDGHYDVALNKFEDYGMFTNDQIAWNGELAGVFPLAEEPAYPASDPTEEPATPARPHRIRHWFGRMFEALGQADPYGIIMYF